MFLSVISNILEPLSYLIFTIALFVQLRIFAKTRLKVLFAYTVLAVISLSCAIWLAAKNTNNNWIYNMLYLPAICAFCIYFYHLFHTTKNKRIALGILGLNVVYFLAVFFIWGPLEFIDSVGYSLLSVSVCILSFVYFYTLLSRVHEHKIWHKFDFWLVSALLFYFLGCFFIFLLYSNLNYNILSVYTSEQRQGLTVLWSIHTVLLFISSLAVLFSSLWISRLGRSA